MAGETTITIVGNLVDEPELRFTPAGAAVAKFRIASTPRVFNKTTNQWEDGESLFLTCSVWRQAAENAAETLTKGTRVIVQGRLKQRSYEDREQVKRTVYEIDVDEVGPSLLRASAKVTKNPAAGGQQAAQPSADGWGGARPAQQQAPAANNWDGQKQPAPAAQVPGYSDQPPF
ncbi:single-stranded DNA-binding protein [Streptomyces sp. P9(2023)]|uniref:single-stranded DNA-binding protein n=1 Tax=Streptomyces sp. P9(2023) TaxID=3064394 RepID=UPI0028F448A7|nr:single-stranded DNA-binding protein [Streptomyces sp. P9(2023)]MDT9689415.1 single-stranded DNA-binding protein [Streptomyces sp. P9(2023)]